MENASKRATSKGLSLLRHYLICTHMTSRLQKVASLPMQMISVVEPNLYGGGMYSHGGQGPDHRILSQVAPKAKRNKDSIKRIPSAQEQVLT